jgi:hypothetical protein
MPAANLAAPQAQGAPAAKGKAAPPPARRPFRAGVQSMEDPQYDNTRTLTASTQDFPDFQLNGDGFLRKVWVLCQLVTSANAATVTFAQNGPWNAIDTIQFLDTAQRPIFGPFDGYTAFSINKWGGYFNQNDPRADVIYSATAGSGGTGGSFTFALVIPLEIASRDGLGSLVNKNTAVPYKVKFRAAASTTPYGTAPTTPGSLRVRMVQDNWWEPEATDPKGHPLSPTPPQVNTTQFWASNNYPLNAGSVPGQQLTTGLGYPLRVMIMMLLDASNSRAQGDADWPDPVTLTVEKNQLFQRAKALWQSRMGKSFDLLSGTADSARTLENGVYPVWFNDDFGLQPGDELRNGYLITRGGQNFLWTGTIGGSGAHTLFTFVNYVAPANGDAASLAMGGR